jgi:hypothetical protein
VSQYFYYKEVRLSVVNCARFSTQIQRVKTGKEPLELGHCSGRNKEMHLVKMVEEKQKWELGMQLSA